MNQNVGSYGNETSSGRLLSFENGEYFQVEVDLGVASILWSSQKAINEIVDLLPLRRLPIDNESLIKIRDIEIENPDGYEEEEGTGTAVEVLNFISVESRKDNLSGKSIAYVRIPFKDFTFVWRRDARKFARPTRAFPEISLIYPSPVRDTQFKIEFLEASASSNLCKLRSEILENFFHVRPEVAWKYRNARLAYSSDVVDAELPATEWYPR
ncbi:hypothetical protein [Arthrobacter wenxiniae]|uniref:Uncharacterized protein n=1 Tax=Arthrobacter wenxiniae TaxID=2713570 RepID=A0A7Y7IIX0_9MICC|nr:hypothetical protein [Arthrobacter wenxiniae]NVM96148.1 hypothetical protein [Arthrobacter wenxiniae]